MPIDNVFVYPVEDRPDVQVEVDGDWYPGEARMRTRHSDGRLIYNCSWRTSTGQSARLDNFPAERVRIYDTDWAAGR